MRPSPGAESSTTAAPSSRKSEPTGPAALRPAHFKDCKNLTYLDLQKTKVTAAKIEELKKVLPKCKIEWDGGVIKEK
jgi:hypothetical protein